MKFLKPEHIDWKILTLIFLLIAIFPLLSRLVFKSDLKMEGHVKFNDRSKEFTFRKDILANKGAIIFQSNEVSSSSFKKNYLFNFEEVVNLKIPPVIHIVPMNNFHGNIELIIQSKKSYVNPVGEKSFSFIQCLYRLDELSTETRFFLLFCGLNKYDDGRITNNRKNIFDLESKKEITVSGNDVFLLKTFLINNRSNEAVPFKIEANFDFSF